MINTPEYDRAFDLFFREAENAMVRSSSHLLGSIPRNRSFERLPRMISGGGTPGTDLEHSAIEISLTNKVNRVDIEETNIESFEIILSEIAGSVVEQTSKALFEMLSKITEATGQVVKTNKDNLLVGILHSLETIEWEWDEENQQVQPPTLYVGTDMSERLKTALAANPKFMSQYIELAERKNREHLANRRSRRIRDQSR